MIKETIRIINKEISNQTNNEDCLFDLKYSTNGSESIITFLGFCVWDSENHVCYYNEETDRFESIEQCVRRRVDDIIRKIKGISLTKNK
jgi:hypothetical protein